MALDRLLGTWDVTMRHVAVPDPVAARQRYERVLDGAFVRMEATYDHPDFPDAIALLDPASYHYFDVRGYVRRYDLQVDDTGWRTERHDPDFWQRSATRFTGPDAMEGEGENSFDAGATWQHDFTITYARAD